MTFIMFLNIGMVSTSNDKNKVKLTLCFYPNFLDRVRNHKWRFLQTWKILLRHSKSSSFFRKSLLRFIFLPRDLGFPSSFTFTSSSLLFTVTPHRCVSPFFLTLTTCIGWFLIFSNLFWIWLPRVTEIVDVLRTMDYQRVNYWLLNLLSHLIDLRWITLIEKSDMSSHPLLLSYSSVDLNVLYHSF